MTWRKDGSGLDVKRVRGMTLPQWLSGSECWPLRDNGQSRSLRRWPSSGRFGRVSSARGAMREARKKRRDRRVNRQAKAAARRAFRGIDLRALAERHGFGLERHASAEPTYTFNVPTTWDTAIIRTTSPDGKVSEFRIGGSLDGPGPVVVSYDSSGGPTSEARSLFEDARQEADAAIARAILGA